MSTGQRNGGIDLIRGVSILVVLLHHFNIAYRLPASPLAQVVPPELIRAICRNGNYGVTLFFAVSGFLITGNTLSRWGGPGRIRLGQFYALRLARIMPCLLLLLAIVTALGLAGLAMFQNHSEAGPPVTFLQADLAALSLHMNTLMARAGWFNYCLCVLWSLSVEEVFYLTFPLLWLVLRRDRWLLGAWLAVILAGPWWRAAHQGDDAGYLYAYFACFDGIAIGCATALLAARTGALGHSAATAIRIVTIPAMTALYLWRSIGDTNIWGVTVMALGTALLLLASQTPPARTLRPSRLGRAIRTIGRHSYELYLFHLLVLAAMRSLWPPARIPAELVLPWLALYFAAALALSVLIARSWSEPANRALRRLLLNEAAARAAA